MNTFFAHHKDAIRVRVSVLRSSAAERLDQAVLAGGTSGRVFNFYGQQVPVSRGGLRDIAAQFQNWVVNRWGHMIHFRAT